MKKFLIKILAFSCAFYLALGVVNFLKIIPTKNEEKSISQNIFPKSSKSEGSGFSGACSGEDEPRNEKLFSKSEADKNNIGLKVLYKPRALYTKEAKLNNIQGKVRVRVTFLANGEIGSVSELAGLPFGLTEKAVEAAKKMRFEPQEMNGEPVTVTKVVVFDFTIY